MKSYEEMLRGLSLPFTTGICETNCPKPRRLGIHVNVYIN